MQGFPGQSRTRSAAAVLLGFALVCQPAGGQDLASGLDRPHFAVGYAANAPNLMGGGGAYLVTRYFGGIGVYLDAKFDVENPSGDRNFESGLTADDVLDQVVGAQFIKREASYRSFNAALVRPVSPYLIVYAGGGLVQRSYYHLYEAPSEPDLGYAGVFWVKAPSEDDTQANFMLGVFMRVSSFLSTQAGIETQPRGFTVGASFRLPRN
jgi:hypothetical protein